MEITIFHISLTYLVAFGVNFIDSIKFPDSNVTALNFIASSLFIISLSIGIKHLISTDKRKYVNLFLLSGFISGVVNYALFGTTSNITNLASGVYCLFITPLFGINLIFNVKYGVFSVIMSLLYLIILVTSVYFTKRKQTY